MKKDIMKILTNLVKKIYQQSSFLQERKVDLQRALSTLIYRYSLKLQKCDKNKIYLIAKKQNKDAKILITIQDITNSDKIQNKQSSYLTSYIAYFHYYVEEHDYQKFEELDNQRICETYLSQDQIELLPQKKLKYARKVYFHDDYLTIKCIKDCNITDLILKIQDENSFKFANLLLKKIQENLTKLQVEFIPKQSGNDWNLINFTEMLDIQTLQFLCLNLGDEKINNLEAKAICFSIRKLINLSQLKIQSTSNIAPINLKEIFKFSQLDLLTSFDIQFSHSDLDSSVINNISNIISNLNYLQYFKLIFDGQMLEQRDFEKLHQSLMTSDIITEVSINNLGEFNWHQTKDYQHLDITIYSNYGLKVIPFLQKDLFFPLRELVIECSYEEQNAVMKMIIKILSKSPHLLIFEFINKLILSEENELDLIKAIRQITDLRILNLEIKGSSQDYCQLKSDNDDVKLLNQLKGIDDVTIYSQRTGIKQQVKKTMNGVCLSICLGICKENDVWQSLYRNHEDITILDFIQTYNMNSMGFTFFGLLILDYINLCTNLQSLRLKLNQTSLSSIYHDYFPKCQKLKYLQIKVLFQSQFYSNKENRFHQYKKNLIRKSKRLVQIDLVNQ